MGITITFKSTVNMMGMKDTILVRCASGHAMGAILEMTEEKGRPFLNAAGFALSAGGLDREKH